MLKLGTFWNVQRKVKGNKRPPREVAKELDERMLEKGKELLTANVAEAAAQSGGNVAEPSARKVTKKTQLRQRSLQACLISLYARSAPMHRLWCRKLLMANPLQAFLPRRSLA